MIDPIPFSRQRHTTSLILAAVVILTAFPTWFRLQREHRNRLEVASEYQTYRPAILSEIGEAAENQEPGTLGQLQQKYAGHVSDRQFKDALADGMAALNHRETETELTVAKLLDIERHREELGSRHFVDTTKKESPRAQRLSVLPR